MTFIVYKTDNHAANRTFKTKGAATRYLNSANSEAFVKAGQQARHEQESVEVFERLLNDPELTAEGRISTQKYLDAHKAKLADALKIISGEVKAYRATTVEDFHQNVVFMRKVTNLMSGKEVEERSDTPYSCSVASESYWSN